MPSPDRADLQMLDVPEVHKRTLATENGHECEPDKKVTISFQHEDVTLSRATQPKLFLVCQKLNLPAQADWIVCENAKWEEEKIERCV
jgi:hypothetical protein